MKLFKYDEWFPQPKEYKFRRGTDIWDKVVTTPKFSQLSSYITDDFVAISNAQGKNKARSRISTYIHDIDPKAIIDDKALEVIADDRPLEIYNDFKIWIVGAWKLVSNTPLGESHISQAIGRYGSHYDAYFNQPLKEGLYHICGIQYTPEPFLIKFESSGVDDFHDPHHSLEGLIASITENYQKWSPTVYESPSNSVINGTMTGKTRTCIELGKRRFVLFCCLRSQNTTGWPDRSLIANYILKESNSCREIIIRFGGFLLACLSYLVDFLNSEPTGDIYSGWNSFYDSIDSWKTIEESAAQLALALDKEYEKDLSETTNTGRNTKAFVLNRVKVLTEVLKAKGLHKDTEPALVFVFDEARTMIDSCPDRRTLNYYQAMKIALSLFRTGIYGLFVDTNSSLKNYYPEITVFDNSFRWSIGTNVFPPHWRMDYWNIMVNKPDLSDEIGEVYAGNVELDQLLSNISCFGRPVWNSIVDQIGLDNLQLFANCKIVGGYKVTKLKESDLKPEHYVAILSCRIALSITPSTPLASQMVSSYAAVNTGISSDHSRIFSYYPSDPMLMNGAASIMNDPFFSRKPMWQGLDLYLKQGVVEAGVRGELLGRIIPLLGMDKAILAGQINETTYMNNFIYPVSVKSFLEHTFHYESVDRILQAQASLKETSRLDELFEGCVFFNCFYNCSYVPSVAEQKEFFSRGCAIFCKLNQTSYDLLIPVRLKCGKMTYIAIQIKNIANSDANYKIACPLMTPEKSLVPLEEEDLPYLCLYFSFGYKSPRIVDLQYSYVQDENAPESSQKAKVNVSPKKVNVPSKTKYSKLFHPGAKAKFPSNAVPENQYLIGFFGCHSSIFPCLDNESDTKLVELLKSHNDVRSEVKGLDSIFAERVSYPTYRIGGRESVDEEVDQSDDANMDVD